MRFSITLVLVFIFGVKVIFAVDFTNISRSVPVTTVYKANSKCYVDVSLFLNTSHVKTKNIFLRVSYVIGTDTLNDNIVIDENYNGVIKQLFLDEGERLTAIIHLNNSETDSIMDINGSFRIVRNPEFKPNSEHGKSVFVGNVWKSDQTPLFRIGSSDSIPKIFRLSFILNENYEYDKFYFKVKVISPSEGIVMLEKEINVNESEKLNFRRKTFTIDLTEIDLITSGSYYFQVMQNMMGTRLNGIEKISYEIVSQ